MFSELSQFIGSVASDRINIMVKVVALLPRSQEVSEHSGGSAKPFAAVGIGLIVVVEILEVKLFNNTS